MENIFYLKDIPIQIFQIAPKEIDFNNNKKVLLIEAVLLFKYQVEGIEGDINEYKKIDINVEGLDLGNFLPLEELSKEMFFPLVIKQAESNKEIENKVRILRSYKGLPVEPLTRETNENKNFNQPFK
jgi:hypothetical protein